MMLRWLAAALAVLASTGVAAAAKPNAQVHAKPSAPRKKTAPQIKPVDRLVLAIAQNSYGGGNLWRACVDASFKNLAWSLQGLSATLVTEKGEFETTEAFDKRRGTLDDALNGKRDIIVCQDLSRNEDALFNYDADAQVFHGSFNPTLRADLDYKKTGSYVSKTRMGVRASVSSFIDVEYTVDMSDRFARGSTLPTCVKVDYSRASYDVPIARDKAPGVKALSYLVFGGRLIAPYIDEANSPGKPTLDDPTDVYEKDLTVHFRPSWFAVVEMDGTRIFDCRLDGSGI